MGGGRGCLAGSVRFFHWGPWSRLLGWGGQEVAVRGGLVAMACRESQPEAQGQCVGRWSTSRRPVAGLIAIGVSTNIDDVARHVAAQRAPFSWLPGWFVGWLVNGRLLDSVAKLPAVTCPILLVRGEIDELIPADMTDRLAAAA